MEKLKLGLKKTLSIYLALGRILIGIYLISLGLLVTLAKCWPRYWYQYGWSLFPDIIIWFYIAVFFLCILGFLWLVIFTAQWWFWAEVEKKEVAKTHMMKKLNKAKLRFSLKKMLMVYLVLIGLIVAVIWCWQKYGSADEFFSFLMFMLAVFWFYMYLAYWCVGQVGQAYKKMTLAYSEMMGNNLSANNKLDANQHSKLIKKELF